MKTKWAKTLQSFARARWGTAELKNCSASRMERTKTKEFTSIKTPGIWMCLWVVSLLTSIFTAFNYKACRSLQFGNVIPAILAFLSNCLHRRLCLRGSCQLLLGERGWCCSPATTWKWLLFKWIPAAASQHSSVELNTTVASCGRALFWSEYWHEMSHVFRTASKLNELNCPNSPQIKKKKLNLLVS